MNPAPSPIGVESIKFTTGGPVNKAQGDAVELFAEYPEGVVNKLADHLNQLQGEGRWFCPAVLSDDYRNNSNWRSAQIAAADIDYHDASGRHCKLPEELKPQINKAANAMELPGQLMYHTPRGFRIVYVFDRYVDDRHQMRRILGKVAQEVAAAIKTLGIEGLKVDTVTKTLTQPMYAPRATVKGFTRTGTATVLRAQVTPVELFGDPEINIDAANRAPMERNESSPSGERKPITCEEVDKSAPLKMPHGLGFPHRNGIEVLTSIPSGEYPNWLTVGMALHHETGGSDLGLELWDQWSQCADGGKYDPWACEEKWNTFGKDEGAVKWGTVVRIAKLFGYGRSRVKAVDAFGETASAPSPMTGESEKLLYTLDELAEDLGAVEFLVSDVLVSYGTSIFHATRKAGKSTVVVSLAMHLASGAESWCGHRIEKHGRTVYISGEGTRGLISRFRVAARELGVDPLKAVRITKRPARITIDGAPNTEELAAWSNAIAKFQAEDTENPVRLIVVDTLSRNIGIGADECKEGDAKAFMESIEGLAEEHGCAALVVHHQPHGADRSRGSTALEAHAEVILSATSKPLKSPVSAVITHRDGNELDAKEELQTDAQDDEAPPPKLVEIKVVAGKEVAGGRKLHGILEGVELEPGKPSVARFRPLRPGENPTQGDRAANNLQAETRVLGAALLHGDLGTTEAIRRSPLGTSTFRAALKRLVATGEVDLTKFRRRSVLRVHPANVRARLRSGLTEAETLKLQSLMGDKSEPD